MQQRIELDKTVAKPVEDEYEVYGRYVAAELRTMTDSYQRDLCKQKISSLLFESKWRASTAATSVYVPGSYQCVNQHQQPFTIQPQSHFQQPAVYPIYNQARQPFLGQPASHTRAFHTLPESLPQEHRQPFAAPQQLYGAEDVTSSYCFSAGFLAPLTQEQCLAPERDDFRQPDE